MRVAIYGGSFNPPHLGHIDALSAAYDQLRPDKMLLVLTGKPPHKELADGSPDNDERRLLLEMAARDVPEAEICDIELKRQGKSYTADTIGELSALYPGAEFFLLIGTDMFLCIESWHRFGYLLDNVTFAVCARSEGEDESIYKHAQYLTRTYGAKIVFVWKEPMAVASSRVRELLQNRAGRELLCPDVYSRIIKNRLYGAKPDLVWLREKAYSMLKPNRIPHVEGTEQEAVRLARRWGTDPELAAEGAILHDITKILMLDEQLLLCCRYGILNDSVETRTLKLLHAKTGAALARDLFGIDDEVYNAILWHTTGRAGMALLDKILYLADYVEPTRSFEGVDVLRSLAYDNIDEAMILGLQMSLEDIRSYGVEPHIRTVQALEWFLQRRER